MLLRPAWSGHWLSPGQSRSCIRGLSRSRSQERVNTVNTDVKYQPSLEAGASAPASNWQHGKTLKCYADNKRVFSQHMFEYTHDEKILSDSIQYFWLREEPKKRECCLSVMLAVIT